MINTKWNDGGEYEDKDEKVCLLCGDYTDDVVNGIMAYWVLKCRGKCGEQMWPLCEECCFVFVPWHCPKCKAIDRDRSLDD